MIRQTLMLFLITTLFTSPSFVYTMFLNPAQARAPGIDTTVSVVSHVDVSDVGKAGFYSKSEHALYYVDAFESDVCRLDPTTGAVSRRNFSPAPISTVLPYENEPGQLLIARRHQLLKLNWATGSTTLIATISPELNGLERFNDANADAKGRLIIGTILDDVDGNPIPNGGSLYRLDQVNGTLNFTRLATGFTVSHGVAWSNDNGAQMYFTDSMDRKIWVFDYNVETGEASNQRVLIDVATHEDFGPDELPDSPTTDSYGYLWVAMWMGGRIVKIDPTTARVVDQVLLPNNQRPSSIAFGQYQGSFGFYVTTGIYGMPEADIIDDGKILFVNINGGVVNGFLPSST